MSADELEQAKALVRQDEEALVSRLTEGLLTIPGTGEVINPGKPVEVARALDSVCELLNLLGSCRRALTELLVEEAQRQGTKTLHLDQAKVTISGGTRLKWDVAKLLELKQAGLPEDRLNAFLKPAVTYSPSGTIARQLEGAGNPEYARIIQEARTHEPAPWRASVELKHG